VRADASLALAETGSKMQATSMGRLLAADTALAHKRLAVAKALHDRLGRGSAAACVVPDVHALLMPHKDAKGYESIDE